MERFDIYTTMSMNSRDIGKVRIREGERKGVRIVLVLGINEGGHSTLDRDAVAILLRSRGPEKQRRAVER